MTKNDAPNGAEEQSGTAAAQTAADPGAGNDPFADGQAASGGGGFLDSIFGGADEQSGDKPLQARDADKQQPGKPLPAGDDEQSGEAAREDQPGQSDDDGMVEIDLGEGLGKQRVPAAVASAFLTQRQQYKSLETEFHRRNQPEGRRGRDGDEQPRQPSPADQQAARERMTEHQTRLGRELAEAFDDEGDGGHAKVGKILMQAAAEQAHGMIQSAMQTQVRALLDQQLEPMTAALETLTEMMAPQLFDANLASALTEVEQNTGVSGLDPKKVKAEIERLAAAGWERNRDTMLTAAIRVLGGSKAGDMPAPTRQTPPTPPARRAAPYRQAPRSDGQAAAAAPSPNNQVVHRDDSLAGL